MKYVGTPNAQIEGMRRAPRWSLLEAIAPTLAYDHAGIIGQSASVPTKRAASVKTPSLVMNGGASLPLMSRDGQNLKQGDTARKAPYSRRSKA